MSTNQWPGPWQQNGPTGQQGQPHPPYPGAQQPWQQGQPMPPQQGPQPYGQQPIHPQPGPAQGYPQPGPAQGYGPGGPGMGGPGMGGYGAPPPPRKGPNPLLIALLAVLVLLVAAGGVYLALQNKEEPTAQSSTQPTATPTEASPSPSPSPTPSKSPSSKTPTPTPTPTPSPTHESFQAPEFPGSFGKYKSIEVEDDAASIWDTKVYESNRDRFVAGYIRGEFLYDTAVDLLENPETFGETVCGRQNEDGTNYYVCYTKVHRGVLQTALGSATTPSDANTVTQEFIAAWQ
ncbi:MAG: hypothetical protein Q4D96_13495 [Propionibacteriaceae bacterium]|nr:hypothetical protein [Propionibacteriaceae bacterium]